MASFELKENSALTM